MTRPPSPHAARDSGSVATRPRIEVRPTAPRTRAAQRARLAPTIARWPLEVDDGFESRWNADAAMTIVRESLIDYRSGRADRASRAWHDDITWSVPGPPPVGGERVGPDGIFAYHELLGRLSEGTFSQRLVTLEGCRGSTVTAYLRTTAARSGRRLEIPTLAVFELAGARVRRVTELPGDRDAWAAFWAD